VQHQWLFTLFQTKKPHPLPHVTFLKDWPHWVKIELVFPLVSVSTGTPSCPSWSNRLLTTPFSYSILICSLSASTSIALFVKDHLYLRSSILNSGGSCRVSDTSTYKFSKALHTTFIFPNISCNTPDSRTSSSVFLVLIISLHFLHMPVKCL